MDTRTTGQEQEKLAWRVWVVGWLRDVCLNIIAFDDFLSTSFSALRTIVIGGLGDIRLSGARQLLFTSQPLSGSTEWGS
jgi:hypothetical protein